MVSEQKADSLPFHVELANFHYGSIFNHLTESEHSTNEAIIQDPEEMRLRSNSDFENGSELALLTSQNDDVERKYNNPSKSFSSTLCMEDITVVSNTINALLGISLFSIPWGFEQSGIFGGTLVLIFVAIVSFETARQLLVAQKVYFQSNLILTSFSPRFS